jgi:branched chain amino acid efflux pump
MSTALMLIVGCAIVTIAIKAAGPIALGGRELPPVFASVVALMPAALLAALVVTHALTSGKHLEVGPVTVGVAASALVMKLTGSITLCVISAAVVTALVRAVAI